MQVYQIYYVITFLEYFCVKNIYATVLAPLVAISL